MGRPRFYKSNKMVPTKEYKANWEDIFGDKKKKKNGKTKSKVQQKRQETKTMAPGSWRRPGSETSRLSRSISPAGMLL